MAMSLPSRSGFTMIETVIVLLIIGVIAAIGLPKLNIFKYKADTAAIQLRSLLMQAQRVTVLHLGKIFARGSLESILEDEKVAEIYLGKTHGR